MHLRPLLLVPFILLLLFASPVLADSACNVCGDGALERGEECDDMNVGAGDGCSGTCELEALGRRCEVTFAFTSPVPLGALQFTIDYSSADGRFRGTWPNADCVELIRYGGNAGLDFDDEEYLRLYFISLSGVSAPKDLFRCVFDILSPEGDAPTSADLLIDIEDASNVDGQAVAGADVFLTTVECSGGSLCGDGTKETFEACDDGNLLSGDGCDAECVPEQCWTCSVAGSTSVCTANTDRSPCSDGDDQTIGDQCLAGSCQQGCPMNPPEGCLEAGTSSLSIRDSSDDDRDAIRWKWKKGAALRLSHLSDPTDDGHFSLCLYPDSEMLAEELAVPAGPFWRWTSGRYTYKDVVGSVDGVTQVRIQSGFEGESSLAVSAKGAALPQGLLPSASYTIQLRDLQTGICWTSAFATGDLREDRFKASAP
jgi:cysteine-rich repeat protein